MKSKIFILITLTLLYTASCEDYLKEETFSQITPELLSQLRNWRPEFTDQDVWRLFTLESLSIPDLDGGINNWEIVYDLEGDDHTFSVIFEGWDIQGIRIDG